ncbi:MAG: hypothetical protein VKJ86_08855 [Synechococcus sp.]|nr:hypothetical protein [Synechococcus sp.]
MIALILGISLFFSITTYIATQSYFSLTQWGSSILISIVQQGILWAIALFLLWCFAEE